MEEEGVGGRQTRRWKRRRRRRRRSRRKSRRRRSRRKRRASRRMRPPGRLGTLSLTLEQLPASSSAQFTAAAPPAGGRLPFT